MITVSPTQDDVLLALWGFLTVVLPPATEIVKGQENRVPEPSVENFVTMTPIRTSRLSTNVDTYADCRFLGSISGATLTVSRLDHGIVTVGNVLYGTNVLNGTTIVAPGTGAGGVGTYVLSQAQTVGSEIMASGVELLLGPVDCTIQLDVHGPSSYDNTKIISNLLRDDYGASIFASLNPAVVPLHADEPKQIPFTNDANQIEYRWVLEICLQANETVTVPQQFADTVTIGTIPADAFYPT